MFCAKYLQIMDDFFFLPMKINVHYSNSATIFCVWGVCGGVCGGVCVFYLLKVYIRSLLNEFILVLKQLKDHP